VNDETRLLARSLDQAKLASLKEKPDGSVAQRWAYFSWDG